MRAYARPDILEHGLYPPASIGISPQEWRELAFEYTLDDYPEHNGTPEHYNLVLKHPETGDLFWAYSIDFDYKH